MSRPSALRQRRRPASAHAGAAIAIAALAIAACGSNGSAPPAAGGSSAAVAPSATAVGPTGTASSPTVAPATGPPAQAQLGQPQVITQGLAVPWGLAFLPGGDALISERDSHRILRVTGSGAATPVGTVAGVAADAGEGGLLGIAVSPTFAADSFVYAYFTSATDNRIVRMTYANGSLGPSAVVFSGIPKAGNHDGGRIAFGPDDLLYVTAGDAARPAGAPDRSYLGGKVLRMTPAGQPAPGNPDPASVIYTVGHRNPQGLAWGPAGELYEAEFGQDTEDEINLLRPGLDYGWPTDEGATGPDRPGLTRPLLTWSTDDASPSGLAYAGGSLWLAGLRGERLYRIPLLAGGQLGTPQAVLPGAFGRLRTVALAPDGSLWVMTSNRDGRGSPVAADDRIIRVPLT